MSIARIRSFAFAGIEAVPVEVQVQISNGLPAFLVVGLPDKAVGEARERVRAALTAMGLSLPPKRVLINLAPADLLKETGGHILSPNQRERRRVKRIRHFALVSPTGSVAQCRGRAFAGYSLRGAASARRPRFTCCYSAIIFNNRLASSLGQHIAHGDKHAGVLFVDTLDKGSHLGRNTLIVDKYRLATKLMALPQQIVKIWS
jgi:hypothetical protein